MNKDIVRKNLYLDRETADYLEQFRVQHHLRFFSVTLLTIIDEHRRLSKLMTPEMLQMIEQNNTLLKKAVTLLEDSKNEKA